MQTGRLDAYIRLHIKKPSTPPYGTIFEQWHSARAPVVRASGRLVASSGQCGRRNRAGHRWPEGQHSPRLVLVGDAYRQRVIPVVWSWVCSSRGHSTTHQLANCPVELCAQPAAHRADRNGCRLQWFPLHRPLLFLLAPFKLTKTPTDRLTCESSCVIILL